MPSQEARQPQITDAGRELVSRGQLHMVSALLWRSSRAQETVLIAQCAQRRTQRRGQVGALGNGSFDFSGDGRSVNPVGEVGPGP
jgi:hypothetical protein